MSLSSGERDGAWLIRGLVAEHGVEHVDMPATPERLWQLLQACRA